MMQTHLNEKESIARGMLCLPLDGLNTKKDIEARVVQLSDYVGVFKVGFGSFTRFGPDAVKIVKDNGGDVFLDLKYHDIPNTVRDASIAATQLGVRIFNVHASGGLEMMKAARSGVDYAAKEYFIKNPPKVIAVTVLTSFDEAKYLETFKPLNPALEKMDFARYTGMKDDVDLMAEFRQLMTYHGLTGVIQNQVYNLASLSEKAGLDGVVCSALDLKSFTGRMPPGFFYATPGIEGISTKAGDDQSRVATPGGAVQSGSNLLVVGRAITKAKDPQLSAYEILQDMAKYL